MGYNGKSLAPLRAKKTFIGKKLGHTAVSSLTCDPLNLARGASGKNCKFANFNMAVLSKTDVSRKMPKYFFFFLLLFNVLVNNFSVMLRRSHLFLGITSTFGE